MARYTALPKIVEAARITSIDDDEIAFEVGEGSDQWLRNALAKPVGSEGGIWTINKGIRIGTLEGTMSAQAGDYIVKGIRDELYAVKGDIFASTYRLL